MSVAVVCTGRSTLVALALLRSDCCCADVRELARLCSDGERMCLLADAEDDDDRGSVEEEGLFRTGGASPKMKNLMNAPMSSTTLSWPRSRPWVNVSVLDMAGSARGEGSWAGFRSWCR